MEICHNVLGSAILKNIVLSYLEELVNFSELNIFSTTVKKTYIYASLSSRKVCHF
jgi:hypothetical protein